MLLRFGFVVAALSLLACGGLAAVPCGDTTCAAGQYCRATCSCCGVPGGTRSGTLECLPIPVGCTSVCGCDALRGGVCSEGSRLVELPCG